MPESTFKFDVIAIGRHFHGNEKIDIMNEFMKNAPCEFHGTLFALRTGRTLVRVSTVGTVYRARLALLGRYGVPGEHCVWMATCHSGGVQS